MSNAPTATSRPVDPRVGDLLGTAPFRRGAFLGFPVDDGVRRNGGRTGAAEAPRAILNALKRMTPDAREPEAFGRVVAGFVDAGAVDSGESLEEGQSNLAAAVERLVRDSLLPVVIGGGHETAWGHFQGLARAGRRPCVVNLDAHADVRPLLDGRGHSGSPFRQILEHDACRGYTVLGLQPFSTAANHLDYLRSKNAEYFWSEEVTPALVETILARAGEQIMVSFDMDAVHQSGAPGVSAPCPAGLAPQLWLDLAFLAGACDRVISFELVEVNPAYDVDDATVRLAAATVWNFLRGVAAR